MRLATRKHLLGITGELVNLLLREGDQDPEP